MHLIALGQDEKARPRKGIERLPEQTAGQAVTIAEGIRRIDENDILIASELPVLKAIIQKQDAHSHFLGSLDRGNAVFPDENGNGGKFSRHHVGLVPCHLLGYEDGSPIRYTAAFFFKAAFIASADDGGLLADRKKELGQHQDTGGLARPACRDIADTDNGYMSGDRSGHICRPLLFDLREIHFFQLRKT